MYNYNSKWEPKCSEETHLLRTDKNIMTNTLKATLQSKNRHFKNLKSMAVTSTGI